MTKNKASDLLQFHLKNRMLWTGPYQFSTYENNEQKQKEKEENKAMKKNR